MVLERQFAMRNITNALGSRVALSVMVCVIVLVFGTSGFVAIEHYTLIDGLYMAAITLSTVGFGEVAPLSPYGRIFVIVLISFSFFALAFAGHAIGQSLLERVWSGQVERKKMHKTISALKNHYIVCGYGRVGAAAAEQFADLSSDFVILEADEHQATVLKEKGYCHIIGDATQEEILESAGIKRAAGLIALLNEDPDNLFVVLTAREMNPTLNIISRANGKSTGHKIIRAGADDVISPFDSAGRKIASEVLKATGRIGSSSEKHLMEDRKPYWVDIEQGSSMIGLSVADLTEHMQAPVLGIRRNGGDELLPAPDCLLRCGDRILVLDRHNGEDACHMPIGSERKRLVIIDDNPVILKLYTRLFQKAGFIPLTASNGLEGIDVIMQEMPQAAVIDFNLPAISGVEVCRKIRLNKAYDNIRLILFTGDSSPQTRSVALDAGADAVVVKSSDASEIIRTVKEYLDGNELKVN